MPKQSRNQRKQIREKRDRAESHGLPVGSLVADKPRASGVITPSASGRPSGGAVTVAGDNWANSVTSKPRGWSSWPLSLKLLLAGILILIGIGLYRRYTEDQAMNAPPQPAQDTH